MDEATVRTTVISGSPEAVCPACRGQLALTDTVLACTACRRGFALVAGIPDLRLTADEEDLARARRLEEQFDQFDFVGLLREASPRGSLPPNLFRRVVARQQTLEAASVASLQALDNERGTAVGGRDRFLEIGCGTGALSTTVAARGAQVVATDRSLAGLVLAKKRSLEARITSVRFVCCAGEALAFPPESFDIVAAGDVIEHTRRQRELLAACRTVLAPRGILFLATPNRFSLSLEPHVRLWGIGFLPRGVARRYVHARRKVHYDIYSLSARQLRALLTSQGFTARIVSPEIPHATMALYTGVELRLVRAYNRVRRMRFARPLLLAVGPFYHVFARRAGDSA